VRLSLKDGGSDLSTVHHKIQAGSISDTADAILPDILVGPVHITTWQPKMTE
jgi:hypothetical protein